MSDPRILLLGPALLPEESETSLKRLQQLSLPNATRLLITIGKFDTRRKALTVNVESGYPEEPALLQTFAAWADVPYGSDPRFRDGYDLFCLRRALERSDDFDFAVLVRSDDLHLAWPQLRTDVRDQLFSTSAGLQDGVERDLIVFNVRDPRRTRFLDVLWDFYISGSAYSLSPYITEEALRLAAEAVQLEEQIFNS